MTVVRSWRWSSMTFDMLKIVRILSRFGFTWFGRNPFVTSTGSEAMPSIMSNRTFSLWPSFDTFNSLVVPRSLETGFAAGCCSCCCSCCCSWWCLCMLISLLAGLRPSTRNGSLFRFSTDLLLSTSDDGTAILPGNSWPRPLYCALTRWGMPKVLPLALVYNLRSTNNA